MNAQIRTKMNLWWTWTEIAIRNAAHAQACRSGAVAARSFESEDSARLAAEFQYSMTAIAAVAFALEALKKELADSGHQLDESSLSKPANCTRGFFVAHQIIQAFRLQDEMVYSLPVRMNDLFRLRNDSVHFESVVRDGVHPHPSGTNTAYELTVYTAEASLSAVQLVVEVLRACEDSAADGEVHCSAKGAAKEMAAVLSMCEETIEVEGLEGIK